MRKRNIRILLLFMLCSVMLFSMAAVVYAADDDSTGRQPVRGYTVGDEVPEDGEGDVNIHGEAVKGDTNNPKPNEPSSSTPNTTQVGGGAYDPITGGKIVKTGDMADGLWMYAAILALGGGLFWILLRKQKMNNE